MIGYAGLSHLGIVSSAAAAEKGFQVVAYDPDAALCRQLAGRRPPVAEPSLPELLAAVGPRLRFTTDTHALAACDLIYISADVPTTEDHRSDLSPVRQLVDIVTRAARPDAVVVILSQVPPGFMRALWAHLETRDGRSTTLLYQVETLAFGVAVERALHPERFIVGCPDPARPLPRLLLDFLGAFGCPVLSMRYESAELCKISINMFLAASLSTANMLAEMCEATGAEWCEIAPALRLDRRIGNHAYLSPGLGIGGGNITRDLVTIRTLARECGTDAQLADACIQHGGYRRDWPLRVLHRHVLCRVAAPVIAVWGLAYKEHTNAIKNSPALHLIRQLRGCTIRAFDPAVAACGLDGVVSATDALDACTGADALAVMTPWPQFSQIDLRGVLHRMRSPRIVDPFGCLDRPSAEELGFEYARLGTGGPDQAAVC